MRMFFILLRFQLGFKNALLALRTPAEAKAAWYHASHQSLLEKKIAERWDELSLAEVKAATTLEEAKAAYQSAQNGSEAEALSIAKRLEYCTETAEAAWVHRHSRCPDLRSLALTKWNELSLAEVRAATTIEAVQAPYRDAPSDSDAEKEAFAKWLAWCATPVEASELHSAVFCKRGNQLVLVQWKWNKLSLAKVEAATTLKEVNVALGESPPESEAKKRAFEKWDSLSLAEVEAATAPEDAKAAYHAARNGSEAEKSAFAKWLALCTAPAEAKAARDAVSKNPQLREQALTRWNELSLAEVEAATTLDEAQAAFCAAPEGSEAAKLAIQKLEGLLKPA